MYMYMYMYWVLLYIYGLNISLAWTQPVCMMCGCVYLYIWACS